MLLLMGAAVLSWEGGYELRFMATMAALVFSLAGDVFLMQDRDLLVQGLVAFLIAHLAYIVAFGGPVLTPYAVFIATAIILVSGPLFLGIRQGLRRRQREKLVLPVLIYTFVISVMVVTAFTAPGSDEWSRGGVVAAALGAGLFYTSDGLIGLHRFVKEQSWAPVAIMVTYHLGQFGLVYGLART
jgi:uncharacterized membrane protein YhhN